MRILIVTASLPYPLASGGAIRTYGILQGLHRAGHTITLLSFAEDSVVNTPLHELCEQVVTIKPPLRSKAERLRTLLLTNQADIATRFYNTEFEKKLLQLLREGSFDLVQFEAIESACYIPIVRQHFPSQKICFDTFNAEAELQRVIFNIDRQEIRRWPTAMYSYIQSRRIAAYEALLCRTADLVIAVSEEDHGHLSRYRDDERTYIVPSGIFVDDYAKSAESVQLGENALVFTGKMDYRPNVDAMLWFAHDILPQIPAAHLTIVGQKPHPRIQHLPERPNISLTGWVDSVLPYLHAADVYIAPLRMGSGTRLKILEAMASGCAIVATSVAASGLSYEVREALVIADTETAFSEAVTKLLADRALREKMGRQAKAAVRAHYDWSVLIPRLLAAYQEVGLGE